MEVRRQTWETASGDISYSAHIPPQPPEPIRGHKKSTLPSTPGPQRPSSPESEGPPTRNLNTKHGWEKNEELKANHIQLADIISTTSWGKQLHVGWTHAHVEKNLTGFLL